MIAFLKLSPLSMFRIWCRWRYLGYELGRGHIKPRRYQNELTGFNPRPHLTGPDYLKGFNNDDIKPKEPSSKFNPFLFALALVIVLTFLTYRYIKNRWRK